MVCSWLVHGNARLGISQIIRNSGRVPIWIASLRWHYPDQVQGYFSPDDVLSGPLALKICITYCIA